jgi:hypothetical protein
MAAIRQTLIRVRDEVEVVRQLARVPYKCLQVSDEISFKGKIVP